MSDGGLIRAYFEADEASSLPAWVRKPEIPDAQEIACLSVDGQVVPVDVELQPNQITGAYPSRNSYLETQYELLREDAVEPLRSAVDEVRQVAGLLERYSTTGALIYEDVGPSHSALGDIFSELTP
jgi:helicase required for RNAi-mediated heterochromatin assembly 1